MSGAIPPLETTEEKGVKFFVTAGLSLILALVLYLGWMALRFHVNPSDSYELLLNAHRLAGLDDFPRYWKRAPMVSILIVPLFWLERFVFGQGFVEPAARILAVVIFAGFLGAVWKLLRLDLGRGACALAVFLCAINRLFIHHAPFTKEDIPGALFTVLTLYFYRRHRQGAARALWLTGLFASMACLTRYNLIPELLGVLLIYEILRGSLRDFAAGTAAVRRQTAVRALVLGGVPVLAVLAVHLAIYAFCDGVSLLKGPTKLVTDILLQKKFTSERGDSTWENYAFLWVSCTGPVILMALLGAFDSLRRHCSQALFYAVWLAVFFLFQTYVLSDKEGRYLFLLMTPVYYFAVAGYRAAAGFLKDRIPGDGGRTGAAVLAVLLLVMPLRNGIAEVLKFQDPFYVNDFERQTSLTARDLAAGGKIFWIGSKYPTFPKEHVFHPNDEFAYIYHYYNHVVRYYVGERVFAMDNADIVVPAGGVAGFFVPYIGEAASNGDVLIVNVEPEDYRTGNLPERLKPLILERVRTLSFYPASVSAEEAVFQSPSIPGAQIRLRPSEKGILIRGDGLPSSLLELYVTFQGRAKPESVQLINSEEGIFEALYPVPFAPVSEVILLGYDKPIAVFHPTLHSGHEGSGGGGT